MRKIIRNCLPSVTPFFAQKKQTVSEPPYGKLILCGALLAGVLLGSIWQALGVQDLFLTFFISRSLTQLQSSSFWQTVGTSFFAAFFLQAVVLFFGSSCIGAPFLYCVPLLRGVPIGCISAYLYARLGMRGMLVNLLLLWLPEVLQAICLIRLIQVSLELSSRLLRRGLLGEDAEVRGSFTACMQCWAEVAVGALAAALLKGLLCAVFTPVLLP